MWKTDVGEAEIILFFFFYGGPSIVDGWGVVG